MRTHDERRGLINSTFWNWAQSLHGFDRTAPDLFELTKAESRDHDRGRQSDRARGMTILEEAKYFALKRLCQFAIDGRPAPHAKDYGHLQNSLYLAYALTVTEPVRDWCFKNRSALSEIASWNYSDLIADAAEGAAI